MERLSRLCHLEPASYLLLGLNDQVLQEFQVGAAKRANPRPRRSNSSFAPASGSEMGAKVVEKVPINVVTAVSPFPMESKML